MGYASRYFRETMLTVAAALLNGVLFYALRIVLYGRLSPEEYGLFYSVFAFGNVLYPLLSFGFDPGLTPLVTRMREERAVDRIKSAVLSAGAPCALVAGAGFAAAWFAAGPVSRRFFGDEQAVALIRIVALYVVVFLPFKTGYMLLLGLQRAASRCAAEVARGALCLAGAVWLLRTGHGAAAAAWAYVLGTAAGLLVEMAALALLERPLVAAPARWRGEYLGRVFGPGKHLTVAFGGALVFSQMDTVMLTAIRGDLRAVAAYQLAVPTIMIVYAIALAGVTNFMPMVTTLWNRGERELLADGIDRIHEAAAVLILPGSAVLAAFSDVLMQALFRRDILDAPAAFNILALGGVAHFLCMLNLHALAGIGLARAASTAMGTALALNLALNAALIPLLGIRGAAAATVLSHAAATALELRALRGALPLRPRLLPAAGAAFAAVLVMLGCALVRRTGLFAAYPVPMAAAAGGASYALAVGALEACGLGRLRELASVIRRGTPG